MRIHWHLGYSNKTACGMLAYPSDVTDEFDTPTNNRIECTKEERLVTCRNCQKVMRLGKWGVNWTVKKVDINE